MDDVDLLDARFRHRGFPGNGSVPVDRVDQFPMEIHVVLAAHQDWTKWNLISGFAFLHLGYFVPF
ncbi:MAG: hypothetical protein WC509_05980 [Candidatus Izemoplasmatales bacterium]